MNFVYPFLVLLLVALAAAITPDVGASLVGGIEINDLIVEDIASILQFNEFDAAEDIFEKRNNTVFKVRRARLFYKPFTVTVDVKSDVATEALFKFYLGPRYDSNDYSLSTKDLRKTLIELDSFDFVLTPGQNTIKRTSQINSSLSLRLTNILQNEGLNFVVSATKLK